MKKLLLIVVALVLSVPTMTIDAGIFKKLGKEIVKDQAKQLVAESQGKKYETRLEKLNKHYKKGGEVGSFKEHQKKEKSQEQKAVKKNIKKVDKKAIKKDAKNVEKKIEKKAAKKASNEAKKAVKKALKDAIN